MRAPIRILHLLLLPLAAGLWACDQVGADRDAQAALSEQRAMLSEGYSLLYADATKIENFNLVLFFKIESQEFNDLLTVISRFGDELTQDLERIARDYPGVRIDLDPLPEMETRKRFALAKDRAIRFAPLSGRSRLEYERTLLIALAGALDHERHLCQVLAQAEPDATLKKILLAAEKRYDGFYEATMDLLNREHFKNNTNTASRQPQGE
jgi:hypothetical protein